MIRLIIRTVPFVAALLVTLVGAAGVMGKSVPSGMISALGTVPPDYRYILLMIDVERGVYIPIRPTARGITEITFSPDGRHVLLQSGSSRVRYHILNLTTGDIFTTPLNYDIAAGTTTTWSPDSSRYMFNVSFEPDLALNELGERGLYVIDHERDTIQRIYESATIAMWSPDSSRIAIRTPSRIFVVNADGSDPVDVANPAIANTRMIWSPDGSQLLYDMRGQLLLAAVDGSAARNLTDTFGILQFPQWSPDGEWMAFLGTRNRLRSAFSLHLDSGRVYHIDTGLSYNVRRLEWTSDSKQLVIFTENEDELLQRGTMYVSTADGESVVQIANGVGPQVFSAGRFLMHQNWEHVNGRYSSRLYLADLQAQSDLKPLIFEPGDAMQPAWSSDGDDLTFIHNLNGISRLIHVDARSRSRRILSNPPYYILRFAYWQ